MKDNINSKKYTYISAFKNTAIFFITAFVIDFIRLYLTDGLEDMICSGVYLLIISLIVFVIFFKRIEKNRKMTIVLYDSIDETKKAYNKQAICQVSLENQIDIRDRFIRKANFGVVRWSKTGEILEVNPFFLEITKFKTEELIGRNLSEFLCDKDGNLSEIMEMYKTIREDRKNKRFIEFMASDGKILELSTFSMPFEDDFENITSIFTFAVDVTEEKKMERTLNYLAYYDDITGLPNRHKFYKKLTNELKDLKDKYISLLYFRVDDYKIINRALKQEEIHTLLKETARRIGNKLASGEYLAKLDEDEFIIMLNGELSEDDLREKAESIIKDAQKPILMGNDNIYVNLKVGGVISSEEDNPDEFVKKARMAFYSIKDSLDSRYSIFRKEIGDRIIGKNYIVTELEKAIEDREFVPYFQPILDMTSKKIIAFETLIRWIHSEKGFIPPMEFIPISEETGQIYEITSIIIEKAIEQKSIWKRENMGDFKLSVNISSKSLNKGSLLDEIVGYLDKYDVSPEEIILEITETAEIDDELLEDILKEFNQIKELGMEIALDDFGTGNSSLARLSKLPIDYLKLDAGFIKNIVYDEHEQKIVKSVIELANKLGLTVIAEGVENNMQLKKMEEFSCDAVQGYFISRPIPAKDVKDIL